ncbi:Tn3 family transposase [Streptosporangium roseum]|uniref:Tn3 family transposase n=1 Tax=Streptosporangium roseum TaxID=2001 RepID=UPI00331A36ED
MVPTARGGRHTLDELLGDATDLPITEHATGPHGATLVNFGLFDLVGKTLSPRIRGKWSAASRQNTLAAALKKRGRMRRTMSAVSGRGNRNIASPPAGGSVPGTAGAPRTSPGADGVERVSASIPCPAGPFGTSLPMLPLAPVTMILMSPFRSRRCG